MRRKRRRRKQGGPPPRLIDRLGPLGRAIDRWILDAFHRRWYAASWGMDPRWLGVRLIKSPFDLWVYQELLVALRPDLVIETGTFRGGSALYLASIMDLTGHGRVVTVDLNEQPDRPEHRRITYLAGSSVAPEVVERVRTEAAGAATVMVILDSDHRRDHVLAELRAYGPMVTVGSYLICEDTNVSGHPVPWDQGPGPWEAVTAFLAEDRRFRADPRQERYLLTMHPRGFLKRVR